MRRLVIPVMAATILAGGSPGSTMAQVPSTSPVPSVVPPSGDPPATSALVLTLVPDRATIVSGEPLTITATLRNDGTTPVPMSCPTPVSLWLDLSPAFPARDFRWSYDWVEGARSAIVGSPATGSGALAVKLGIPGPGSCVGDTLTLEPDASLVVTGSWDGRLGAAPLSVPEPGSIVAHARADLVLGSVEVEQSVGVLAGPDPAQLSAGAAFDSLVHLSPEALDWLLLEPPDTIRRAPAVLLGDVWKLEVIRTGGGCCRERLVAEVGATDGTVRNLRIHPITYLPGGIARSRDGDLVMTVQASRPDASAGGRIRLRTTVTNHGAGTRWFWGGCGANAPELVIQLPATTAERRRIGRLGTVRSNLASGHGIWLRTIDEPEPPGLGSGDSGCQGTRAEPIRPGASISHEVSWLPTERGTGAPAVEVAGFLWLATGPGFRDEPVLTHALTAHLRLRVPRSPATILGPAAAADALLADPRVAARLRAVPPGPAAATAWQLDEPGTAWRFSMPWAPGRWVHATVDATTGDVAGVRPWHVPHHR